MKRTTTRTIEGRPGAKENRRMTDPTERTPPEVNPFQSPGVGKGPSRIDATSPSVIHPRWWEVLVFAVLLLFYLAYSPFNLVSVLADFRYGNLVDGLVTLAYLLETIAWVTSIAGGMVALRLWWWKMLPEGLAPGHYLMLTALFAWGTYGVLGIIIGMTGEFLALSREELGTIDSLLMYAVTPVLHPVLLLLMLPRFSGWFWAAAFTLVGKAAMGLWRMSPPLAFSWGDMGMLLLLSTYALAATIAAIILVVVAVRQRKQEIRRDWLHWTGVACWLGMIMCPLVVVLVLLSGL